MSSLTTDIITQIAPPARATSEPARSAPDSAEQFQRYLQRASDTDPVGPEKAAQSSTNDTRRDEASAATDDRQSATDENQESPIASETADQPQPADDRESDEQIVDEVTLSTETVVADVVVAETLVASDAESNVSTGEVPPVVVTTGTQASGEQQDDGKQPANLANDALPKLEVAAAQNDSSESTIGPTPELTTPVAPDEASTPSPTVEQKAQPSESDQAAPATNDVLSNGAVTDLVQENPDGPPEQTPLGKQAESEAKPSEVAQPTPTPNPSLTTTASPNLRRTARRESAEPIAEDVAPATTTEADEAPTIQATSKDAAAPAVDLDTNSERPISASDDRIASPLRIFGRPLVGQNTTTGESQTEAASKPTVDPARFVQRVSGAMRAANQGDGRIQLRLSPPELGSLKIEIVVKQGALTASLETETVAARNVLLDNLPALRERLAEQDIQIEKFDVDVRRDGQQQPDNQDAGERPTRQSDSQSIGYGRSSNPKKPDAEPTVLSSLGPTLTEGLDVRI